VALTADCRLQDLEEVRGRPVLADDADVFPDETLFHLINMAGESGGGLLLTARRAPALWSADLPDLRSRLNAIQVAELAEPDDEMLDGVMRKFFRERNIRPTEELLSYLIRRIERSVPAAREMVNRLDDAADAAGRPVSRTLAREILEAGQDSGDLFQDSLVRAPLMGEKPGP
jgi:chromosomal replication initiation ATPase DnaA